ncbi:MAG: chaperone modulator CbpM [Desulfovibrionaceae bacterium]|jgi:chaperone modulatory protein CbpM|nr:chaperone modulator CbpM [Desulfovibrionaceae bacterium]
MSKRGMRTEISVPADFMVPSDYISWAQFLERTGVHPSLLGELIELGWVCPLRPAGQDMLFRPADVYRLQKFRRLCRDFDLTVIGGTIVVDLLERIDCLERKIRDLERLLAP